MVDLIDGVTGPPATWNIIMHQWPSCFIHMLRPLVVDPVGLWLPSSRLCRRPSTPQPASSLK
eukprot:7976101-Prorocentrum_lima.AAC.1